MKKEITVIGTRMSDSEITAYLGYMPDTYNKETSQLLREICVLRGYFNKVTVNKIKFFRIVDLDFKVLTNGPSILLEILRTGANWKPDIALKYLDFKEVESVINSKYPYGKMNNEIRKQYVIDISNLLGNKLLKVELSS